jgi:hypothetical protein
MRTTLASVGLGLVVGAWAGGAQAGPLIQATFGFRLGTLPPATYTASGGLAGVAHGTGGGAVWAVGALDVPAGTSTRFIGSSAAPPITQVQYILNGNPAAGSFHASVNGSMAVTGQTNVKAYGGLVVLGVPVVVGTPSLILPPVVGGAITITAHANAWTTRTTSIFVTTLDAPMTRMGSNGLVNGGGTVVLVSGLNVLMWTNRLQQLPSFATLTLTYAPDAVAEPGALGLLAIGAACAWLARRRRGGGG